MEREPSLETVSAWAGKLKCVWECWDLYGERLGARDRQPEDCP